MGEKCEPDWIMIWKKIEVFRNYTEATFKAEVTAEFLMIAKEQYLKNLYKHSVDFICNTICQGELTRIKIHLVAEGCILLPWRLAP